MVKIKALNIKVKLKLYNVGEGNLIPIKSKNFLWHPMTFYDFASLKWTMNLKLMQWAVIGNRVSHNPR